MNRLQGVQRRLQSIFSLHRRKMAAKLVVSRYSKVKALAKASSYKFAVGYKYLAHKVATDESARMILAALLLVILISWVAMAVTKRRRRRRSQTKLQKEKLSEVDAAVKRPLLKSILKDSNASQAKRTASLTRGATTTTFAATPSSSSEPTADTVALQTSLIATQTELAELKTTVAELLSSRIQTEASRIAEITALKGKIEVLTAKVDSVETDAGLLASQEAVVDSVAQGQARLEKSIQALMAWRAQVAAYDTVHPAATQSDLDRIAAEVAASASLVEAVRDAQERLSANLQLNFSSAIKDLMQCLEGGRKGAITRGVRCSTSHGSASPAGSTGSGAGGLQVAEMFAAQRTGACLE